MTIELSCGLPPGPDFAELALLAEKLGYSRVWIFDTAPLWEDPFIHLALAAERTSQIGLGTAVLIPGPGGGSRARGVLRRRPRLDPAQ